MSKNSMTIWGVFVALGGTFLVNTLGFTDACVGELSSKAIEFGPLLTGSIMSWIGRYRLGGVTILGRRTR